MTRAGVGAALTVEWPELLRRLYTWEEVQAMLTEAYAEGRADQAAEPRECQQIDAADRKFPKE